MPIFAPAYFQPKSQQSYLIRQQHLESKKRKREAETSDEDDDQKSDHSDPSTTLLNTSFHPVNKTDPYHVAGHSRELPLPPPPFPHAAVKGTSKKKVPIEQELASLNPPLYVPPHRVEEGTSLRRRHLDNVTTILHRCMLNGDWTRAARAWSLLLRTEVAGRGIDVRRNGRWGIGGEILMRGVGKQGVEAIDESEAVDRDGSVRSSEREVQDSTPSPFTDEGFRLAREYYERLILQYPHTPYTRHSLNATAIYPALFNVWIYEVRDRSKRARKLLRVSEPDSAENSAASIDSNELNPEERNELFGIRSRELEEAIPIANRMDELLLSPPYDTSASLLQLRGMVAMWISDLHAEVARFAETSSFGGPETSPDDGDADRHDYLSQTSLRKAKIIFNRLQATGAPLPQQAQDILAEENE